MSFSKVAFLSVALLASVSLPAQAGSLLGIVGCKDDKALVTLGKGDAGDSGLVNVGVGGGGNQVLDAKVGNGSVANATVGAGGSSVVDANVGLLNDGVRVRAQVGGDNLADVDVGIGGGSTPGNDSGGGGTTGGGGSGGGGNGGGQLAGTGSSDFQGCQGISPAELQRLIQSTRVDASWSRATNVNVRRVKVCPELRSHLAAALRQTGLNNSLRSAITGDPLVAATLSRMPYGTERVFAARQSGRNLVLYVY
ncbi:hypothetical protein GGR20_001295 [Devosia subaequoris]|uniref:Uncharacterized protein n=1 Tax=Devosia subaequoris TaxID=395930 RepID=A0A7W6NBG5_9HYPH|nr:hypothetical protein [Devosia subaequoris]MBB4051659.1 hypothetical protein [Devosia subaequoris]MCP1209246.1 hypothetical protein [Devosia subaequoris]